MVKTLFQIKQSRDKEVVSVISLEGDVYLVDVEENELLTSLHLNNSRKLGQKKPYLQENSIIDFEFYFPFVKSKSNPEGNEIRSYETNTALFCSNDGTMHEFCPGARKTTHTYFLDPAPEKLLALQNYRYSHKSPFCSKKNLETPGVPRPALTKGTTTWRRSRGPTRFN